MTNINTAFCRHMLTMAHKNIKRAFPGVNLITSIGCVGPHSKQYFVEIRVPGFANFDDYYSADNATHAKAEAWNAFFDKYAPEQIKREVDAEAA